MNTVSPRRFGLSARFALVALVGLALVTLITVLTWTNLSRSARDLSELNGVAMRDLARQALRLRGEETAQLLADALTNPLYYFDLLTIREITRSTLRQVDVDYVLVFDAEGRIIHDGSGDIPTFGQPMDDVFAWEAIRANGTVTQWSDSVVDVAHPVTLGDDRLGGVRLGYSLAGTVEIVEEARRDLLARSAQAREQQLRISLLAVLAMLLLGIVLSLLVSRGLVSPIRKLAGWAREIERGNFEKCLDSARSDEVGELIRGFGRMGEAVQRHHDDVRRLAYLDSLTGLPNRLMFRELLDRRLAEAQGHGTPLALLFIDLDDFKRINDTLGHDSGDEVLVQAAERLRRCLLDAEAAARGEEPMAARFGGDEFVVLVGGDDAREHAAHLSEAILATLRESFVANTRQVFLNASIGITVFPDDATTSHMLLKNGDIAMYQAKVHGKNCYRHFSARMTRAAEDRMALEQDLRGAITRGEFSLHFQPIIALEGHQLRGAEALLRWQHPERGPVPPAVFVPVAEDCGLIEEIGIWVLREACIAALEWRRPDGSMPFLAVNLSGRQLRRARLTGEVAQVLQDTGFPAGRLHLELSENTLIGDEPAIVGQLTELRALGVQVWLDDFGTGFSGLSHLRRVPVDGVKIDRSFVTDLLTDPDDLALTSAIIAMAHSLGMVVVAEGVESEGQLDVLRERGCDFAQGYWLGRPLTANGFAQRLEAPDDA
jgi:diguanylate cyclase (GGDEF)-like protein